MPMNFSGINPQIAQSGYFESDPRSLWNYGMPQGSSNWRNWYQNEGFNQAYGQDYNKAMLQDPSLQWKDFAMGYDPWAEFRQLTPQQRGENKSQFAPNMSYNLSRGG